MSKKKEPLVDADTVNKGLSTLDDVYSSCMSCLDSIKSVPSLVKTLNRLESLEDEKDITEIKTVLTTEVANLVEQVKEGKAVLENIRAKDVALIKSDTIEDERLMVQLGIAEEYKHWLEYFATNISDTTTTILALVERASKLGKEKVSE